MEARSEIETLLEIGNIRLDDNMLKEAFKYFRTAYLMDNNNFEAICGLGLCYLMSPQEGGDPEKAVALFKKAALFKASAYIIYDLAVAYNMAGKKVDLGLINPLSRFLKAAYIKRKAKERVSDLADDYFKNMRVVDKIFLGILRENILNSSDQEEKAIGVKLRK